jgi:hypothetical protein
MPGLAVTFSESLSDREADRSRDPAKWPEVPLFAQKAVRPWKPRALSLFAMNFLTPDVAF